MKRTRCLLDRQLRSPEELRILASAHVCRMYSDLTSLWCFSGVAIAFRFDPKARMGADLQARFERVRELTEPFMENSTRVRRSLMLGCGE